ncbi:MOSC domain-containing protein [Nostoc sp. XA013]|nr:MOSC domain-containing protein [Nostoc sp. XA013]
MLQDPILSAIYIYPVKSCRGISLNSARLDTWGLECDRRWMVVDANGYFLTQRQLPRMALVETALNSEALCLNAPNMPELRLPLSTEVADEASVRVWRDCCQAVDQGNEASEWFSSFLGVSCRLVRMPKNFVRPVDRDYAPQDAQVSFADGFPLLIISEASLSELNSHLQKPIPMNRFRPNLVVTGCEAFSEDSWHTIQICSAIFYGVKRCRRCVITTVDQATGSRGKEPLVTLATFRRVSDGIIFGQNLVHAGVGELQVGNTIEVLKVESPVK